MNWFWRPIHKTIFPNTCCVKFHWFNDSSIAFQSTPGSLDAKMTNIFWHKVAARSSPLPLWRVRCKIKQWTSLTVLLKPFFLLRLLHCCPWLSGRAVWSGSEIDHSYREPGFESIVPEDPAQKEKRNCKGHKKCWKWTELMGCLFFIFFVFSITFTYPQVFGCAP